MKINILAIDCEEGLLSWMNNSLSARKFNILKTVKFEDIKDLDNSYSVILCPLKTYHNSIKKLEEQVKFPILLINKDNKFFKNTDNEIIDCINHNFTKEEFEFRINNLVRFHLANSGLAIQNEKLKKYFDKNKRKTINLFGKHVDLKKAQKDIEFHNLKLEKAITKNKQKTIELFGKHIDLKKAQKEIKIKNQELELQKQKLQLAYNKKKRKTIDLFGKHVDLKKAQKEIQEKNERLEKVLEKNKQKTIELFGKHIDLKKAKKEISNQKSQIEKQNHSITDSIKYASFIQSAVLTREEKINEFIPNHMLIYMPRDIVSGDFYWVEKSNDNLYIVAADCTGHGVPGAFMSMLGISLLNEMVIRNKNKPANKILDLLREKVISSLNQTGKMDEAADGMDLSFCIINTKTRMMQFAGAHNPVYIMRNCELIEIKGDRMPIGFSLRMNKPFTNNEFQLEKGDKIYLFSDGYADQFGGEHGMKMRYKVFQQHIINSSNLSFEEQKQFLLDKFYTWKGDYYQIDDLLILGFEIL